MRMRLFGGSATLSVLAAVMACSSSKDDAGTGGSGATGGGTTSSSTTSANGGNGGTGGVDPLGCLGSVVWPTASASSIQVAGKLELVPTHQALTGADVRACPGSDASCLTPLGQTISATDGSYSLSLAVTSVGFDGYLEITQPNLLGDLVYFLPPLVANKANHDFGEITVSLYDSYLATGSLARDPARAQLAVTVLGCDGLPLAGMSAAVDSADASTQIAYDTPTGLSTSVSETGLSGVVLFVNLPVGTAHVTVTSAVGAQTVATTQVETRANFVTSVFLPPTP